MTRFEYSVVIRRPLGAVWAYVMETANNPMWQRPIIAVRRPPGTPLEVGSEIPETAAFLGKRFDITLVVTEHEMLKRSAVRTSSGPIDLEGCYRFEEVDGGTRFSTEGEVETHRFFALAEPLFALMARRAWASSCRSLKKILEAEDSPSLP